MADTDPNTSYDSTGGEGPDRQKRPRPKPTAKRAPPKLPTRAIQKTPSDDNTDEPDETAVPRPRVTPRTAENDESTDAPVRMAPKTQKGQPRPPKVSPRPRIMSMQSSTTVSPENEPLKRPQPRVKAGLKQSPRPRAQTKVQVQQKHDLDAEDDDITPQRQVTKDQCSDSQKSPSTAPKPSPRPRVHAKVQAQKHDVELNDENGGECDDSTGNTDGVVKRAPLRTKKVQAGENGAARLSPRPRTQPPIAKRPIVKRQSKEEEEEEKEESNNDFNGETMEKQENELTQNNIEEEDDDDEPPPPTPPRNPLKSPPTQTIAEPVTKTTGVRKLQSKRSAFARTKKTQPTKKSSSSTTDDIVEKPPSPLHSPRKNVAMSMDHTVLTKQQPQAPRTSATKKSSVPVPASKSSNTSTSERTSTSTSTSTPTSSSSSHKKGSSSKKESSHKKRKHHHKPKEEEDDVIAEPLFFDPDGSESLLSIIGRLDTNSSGRLIKKMKELNSLKRKIASGSKRNFIVEGDLAGLDKKISVLIRNKISLDEILSSKGDISENLKELTVLIKDPSQRELYGRMFYLLQRNTDYIAHLAGNVKLAEIDSLLQTVMFTLYGNQYEEDEEHLLLTMFRTVMTEELEKAIGINDLFRSNSALTRMLTTYTRRSAGQEFLKITFRDILGEIVADSEMNLEISPNKVFDEYVNDYEVRNGTPYEGEKKLPTEECAKMPFIQEIIRPRIPIIERYISRFIDQYERNINLVPYGIRWICKQVKLIVLEKWPETDWRQACTMIGGFFILRFVNPAIITPAAYMILDQTPGTTARRNLTVLAKIQQNLSNCARFSDVKEPYMTPLNYIFDRHSDRFLRFLDSLTEVDDLDHHLSLDKYVYLTKFTKNQMITISLNEMYLIHSLLLKYRSVLAPENPQSGEGGEEDPLLKILSLMPTAPPQLPRSENPEVELKLIAPEAKEDFGDEQLAQVAPERLFSETKYYLFNVIRKLPTGMKLRNDLVIPLLDQISEILSAGTNGGSSSSSSTTKHMVANIKKIESNLRQLEALEVTSESDNFLILRQDLSNDITNISSRIKRVEGDISRLKTVLNALDEQYKNVQAQIDTYRQYLDNVRQMVSGAPSSSSGGKASSSVTSMSSSSSIVGGTSSMSSSSSGSSSKKDKDKDPRVVVVTFASLLKDKIVVTTPPGLETEKLSNVNVQFFMVSPGIFDVTLSVNGHEKGKEKLLLDELLESQANGHQTEKTDVLEYNVNLMLYFINKKFVIKAHK